VRNAAVVIAVAPDEEKAENAEDVLKELILKSPAGFRQGFFRFI